MVDLHFSCHIIEILAVVYLITSHYQTKNMLIELAKSITSVNTHLDHLISMSMKNLSANNDEKPPLEKADTNLL